MTRFLELLTSLLIVVVLFVLVGLFLPDQRSLQHNVETSHPLRQVYDVLNSFKRFGDWNPLRQHDPKVKYTISGADRGVGAQIDYSSARKEVGSGSWHITESELDDRIRYTIYNDTYGQNKNHLLEFDQRGKIVDISWTYSVEYGWSLPGRYAGMYVERTVGDDVKRGLANLSNLIASLPNFDYRSLDVQTRAIAPKNILYITTTSDRNITAVENAMELALKDIRAVIKSNGLVEAARPRLITTNFGSEKYEFDVAIPVARVSEAAETVETAPADDVSENDTEVEDDLIAVEDASELPDEALLPPPPLEGLTLPDNVRLGVSYGGRVLVAPYRGHPAQLPLIRDQLRSYAGAYGEELQDRAFEEYLTEIADTSSVDAQFRVYWPIK